MLAIGSKDQNVYIYNKQSDGLFYWNSTVNVGYTIRDIHLEGIYLGVCGRSSLIWIY